MIENAVCRECNRAIPIRPRLGRWMLIRHKTHIMGRRKCKGSETLTPVNIRKVR